MDTASNGWKLQKSLPEIYSIYDLAKMGFGTKMDATSLFNQREWCLKRFLRQNALYTDAMLSFTVICWTSRTIQAIFADSLYFGTS